MLGDSDSFKLAQCTALGRAIARPDEAGLIFSRVDLADFDPPLVYVAEAIQGLRVDRHPIDQLAVIAELERRSTLSRVGGAAEVFRLVEFGFAPADVAVDTIARVAQLRKLQVTAAQLDQRATAADAEPLAIAKAAVEQAQQVIDYIEATAGDVTTPTVGEFLAVEDDPFDWVVPGILERGDRLMLTGSEGLGKSVLFRQLAVSAASGVHPFTHQPIPAQRVLYVDCENGRAQLRRALRALVGQGARYGTDPAEMLYLEARPEGLDLTRAEDEAWLVRTVAALQPAMLLIGPLYRLHAKNPNEEEPARKVAAVLDRCRAAANCAVVVEAHAGHAFGADGKRPVRPTGTSLWLRWPEFGYGLRAGDDYDPARRVVDFVPWRGDRSERDWPSQLASGGAWPWERQHDPLESPQQSYYESER